MSLVGSNALAGASGQGGGGYEIERSLRFNGADSAYLNRTLNATGSGTTGTYSFWIKRSKLLDSGRIINVGNYSAGLGYPTFYIQWNGTNDRLIAYCYYNGDKLNLETDAKFRDTSAWYHVVLKVDTTQATNTNRAAFYVNGVEQTITATTWPNQNDNVLINLDTHPAYIGCRESLSQYLNGYLADLHFIDGQALAASDFGEYDDNNVWQPKKYAGSYGTNGFHLDFVDGNNIGNDAAGSNNWSANNLTGYLPVISSPNRPTWNGSVGSNWSTSNSSYDSDYSGSFAYVPITATLSANTTYHFILNHKDGSAAYGGWFFSSGSTPNSNTVPDELGGNSLGLRVSESSIGTYGTYSTANSTSDGQNQISVSDLQYGVNDENQEFVVNTTLGKVWARTAGASTWVGGGDPSNTSSTATFLIPTGQQYFGYMAYSGSTYANFTTESGDPPNLDHLRDSPTNGTQSDTGAGGEISGNYCTMNPLANYLTLANGNLDASQTSSAHNTAFATMGVSSGKYYWEITKNDGTHDSSTSIGLGVAKSTFTLGSSNYVGHADTVHIYNQSGVGLYDGDGFARTITALGSGVEHTAGTWMLAFDFDAGKGWIGKDGTWLSDTTAGNEGNPATGANPCFNGFTSGTTYVPFVGMYAATSVSANFGQRPFKYNAPSGFKCLCTANLPDPTIEDPSKHFDVKTFAANNGSQSISLGFSPDLVWTKSRTHSVEGQIFDKVRGNNQEMSPNDTRIDRTLANSLTLDSSGFTMPSNNNNANWTSGSGGGVGWAWDAGTSTVTNTDGSLSAQVRAAPSAGFSIVKFTGNATDDATVGHGLNAAPQFVIQKGLTVANYWAVYHAGYTHPHTRLDLTDQAETSSNYWKSFSSTLMTLPGSGSTLNNVNNSADYIAYCWAPVEGFSKFGSYTGSTNGTFVFTNFKTRWLLIKAVSQSGSWVMYDTARDPDNSGENWLYANSNSNEQPAATYEVYTTSNGFRTAGSSAENNGNGVTYIYAAFGEPFKTARAR